jgi:hypothetical protein
MNITEYSILLGLTRIDPNFQEKWIRETEGGCLTEIMIDLSRQFPNSKIHWAAVQNIIDDLVLKKAIIRGFKSYRGKAVTSYKVKPKEVFKELEKTDIFINTKSVMEKHYELLIE